MPVLRWIRRNLVVLAGLLTLAYMIPVSYTHLTLPTN